MKKFDFTPVKNFFFEKGEKLAAIVCAAAAVLLVGVGVMSGMSAQSAPGSNQPFDKELTNQAGRIKNLIAAGSEVAPLPAASWDNTDWKPVKPSYQSQPLFFTNDTYHNKRHNPIALAPLVDPEKKQIQMDYIRGAIAVYAINPDKQWATTPKAAMVGGVDPRQPGGLKPGPKNQAAAGALAPIETIEPKRMILVHATFPLEQQIEEFRKALRMMNQADLWQLQKDMKDPAKIQGSDLPKFLGLNIMKGEGTAGQFEWTPLIRHDWNKDTLEVDPNLMATLRACVFEDQLMGAAFAFQGLVMPMPKFASPGMTYPKLDLPGIENGWDAVAAVGANPGVRPNVPGVPPGPRPGMGNPGVGVGGKVDDVDTRTHWNLLSPEYRDRFFGRFYPLDPEGKHFDPDQPLDNKGQGAVPPPRFGFPGAQANASPYAGGSNYAAAKQWNAFPYPPAPPAPVLGPNGQPLPQQPFANQQPMNMGKPYDALIRFFDVDVVPGKTYKYTIQVRIANPNYGKKSEVSQAAFADIKELAPAPPVETPELTIPEEYFVYATDQKPINPKVPGGSDTEPARADQIAVQIHRWVGKVIDPPQEHLVGDWVIAERLLVRRGDPIGKTIHVEVPVWNPRLGAFGLVAALVGDPNDPAMKQKGFENKGGVVLPPAGLGKQPPKTGKNNVAEKGSMGIPVDFTEGSPPAVLADFDGGKQSWSPRVGTSFGTPVKDESASNLLILRPDGRLIVRNNRADSDENSVESQVRRQRVEEWDRKVTPFRAGGMGAAPEMKGPNQNPFLKKN